MFFYLKPQFSHPIWHPSKSTNVRSMPQLLQGRLWAQLNAQIFRLLEKLKKIAILPQHKKTKTNYRKKHKTIILFLLYTNFVSFIYNHANTNRKKSSTKITTKFSH